MTLTEPTIEAKVTLEKHVATLKNNDDTHNLNYYKTMSNVLDKDGQYRCRLHV